jgi:hypothetical protein
VRPGSVSTALEVSMSMKKICLRVEVKVKTEDWNLAFGTEDATVPEDVAEYIQALIVDGGVFGNGEVSGSVNTRLLRR